MTRAPSGVARPVLLGRAVVGLAATIALLSGAAVVREPLLVVLGLLGLTVLLVLVLRLDLAVLAYVAVEPVGNLLPSVAGVSAVRLVGAVLFGAWLVRLVLDSRPVALRHPAVLAAGALLVTLLASTALSPNGSAGAEVAGRYLSYLAVLVVLLDSMVRRVDPWTVVRVFVWSCTVAAVIGLAVFVRDGGRAVGPQEDPNDLAFFLIAAVPFAIASARSSARHVLGYGAATALLLVGTAATFSRGAALGLLVAVAVGLVIGLLRFRHVVLASLAVVVGVVAVWAAVPTVVDRSLAEKQTVAQANVESRFASWYVAAEMTADHPVLGTGPGGYRTHFSVYEARRTTDPSHLDVAHQMMLDVSSELGLLGAAAFASMLGAGVVAARRSAGPSADLRFLPRDSRRLLGAAALASLAATLAAALFLSEQFYLPLWLLVAVAAAIDPRWFPAGRST